MCKNKINSGATRFINVSVCSERGGPLSWQPFQGFGTLGLVLAEVPDFLGPMILYPQDS